MNIFLKNSAWVAILVAMLTLAHAGNIATERDDALAQLAALQSMRTTADHNDRVLLAQRHTNRQSTIYLKASDTCSTATSPRSTTNVRSSAIREATHQPSSINRPQGKEPQMLGMFGKKKREAAAALKRIENKDLMEAIVGGCLLVAAADGDISEDELRSLDKQLQANPSLAAFGSEINATLKRFEDLLSAGFRMGKMKIMREIEDVKNDPAEAEEVFVNVLTVAEADGNIDAKEMAILKEIAAKLNQRLSDYITESA